MDFINMPLFDPVSKFNDSALAFCKTTNWEPPNIQEHHRYAVLIVSGFQTRFFDNFDEACGWMHYMFRRGNEFLIFSYKDGKYHQHKTLDSFISARP